MTSLTNLDPRRRLSRRLPLALLACWLLLPALALAACGGKSSSGSSASSGNQAAGGLDVEVASYELLAGRDNRFIAGLLTADNNFISYGSVDMKFFYLGTQPQQNAQGTAVGEQQAKFLLVPGDGDGKPHPDAEIGPASQGRGVYDVDPMHFDKAGVYGVLVTAKASGKTLSGNSVFQVQDKPQIPAPGDKAKPTDNYTIDSKDVPPQAIDSRADSLQNMPEVDLHRLTITAALQQHKPLVIVFATPVFCISRFCGPVVDMVAGLQKQYGSQANFIHVEIWQDFQAKKVSPAAAQWLQYPDGDLNEPWVYLVGKDGTILKRWDNVVTPDEVTPALKQAIDAP